MFQIGEFSRIARISTRQLRHYDDLGLFKPAHIDAVTGYRYYSASQLPQLNRILALKDLGLTLDQIARLLDQDVSAEEIHGMLTLKKAQVEQTIRDELARIRSIEERLWQIETEGVLSDDDVVLKSMPEQIFLSIREVVPAPQEGFALMYQIHRLFPERAGQQTHGKFRLVLHYETYETENIDVEMGYLLAHDLIREFALPDGRQMQTRIVPAVETMATLARVGIFNDVVGHYGALGTWIENHHFQLAGAGWEVFLQPFQPGKEDEAVIELQIPVKGVSHE